MYIQFLFLLAGLVGLWFGSDIVVSASKKVAGSLKISAFVVGLTILAIGTSLPEIATSIAAGISNKAGVEASGIAIGDILGSNMANITLLLGICGLFVVFNIKKEALTREGVAALIAILVMFFACADLKLTQQEGVALIFIYALYVFLVGHQEHVFIKFYNKDHKPGLWLNVFLIMVGLGVIIYSSSLVVNNSVKLAGLWGVKEFIIGIFIGLGTSLPELSVSLKAIIRGAHSLSLGNLIGSCIVNPLLGIGAGALISGFSITKNILLFDFPFLFITTLVVLTMLNRNLTIKRAESAILIGVYLTYVTIRVMFFRV